MWKSNKGLQVKQWNMQRHEVMRPVDVRAAIFRVIVEDEEDGIISEAEYRPIVLSLSMECLLLVYGWR